MSELLVAERLDQAAIRPNAVRVQVLAHQASVLFDLRQQPGQNLGDGTEPGLSHVMPVLHPFAAGATGTSHGADFAIQDHEAVAVTPAKAMAMTVIDLLGDGAAEARRVLDEFEPRFSRPQYLEFVRSLAGTQVFDYLST